MVLRIETCSLVQLLNRFIMGTLLQFVSLGGSYYLKVSYPNACPTHVYVCLKLVHAKTS